MISIQIEQLEARCLLSGIKYGIAVNGDPSVTGLLSTTGPGLADLGAKAVRLFTNTSFLSSDFDQTAGGKIYVAKDSLQTSLAYAKKYHDAGFEVTLCIQLSTDRSMTDGSLLTDPITGQPRRLKPTELRSPKVFRTWYDTLSKAVISKIDRTSVTRVIDFWEIGNEPNHTSGVTWPCDTSTLPDSGVGDEMNSYIDHDLIPAYEVLSKIQEPVIGAGLAGGTLDQFNELNNLPRARHHQYSDHVDYLNTHPYGYFGSPVPALTPQAFVTNFMTAMYGDGKVTKPFVFSEYNLSDFAHPYPLDPDPNPRDMAEQLGAVNDLDGARTALLNTPGVNDYCAYIYFYRLIADAAKPRGTILYPPPAGQTAYTPLAPVYDMFRRWAKGTSASTPVTPATGVLNLGGKSVINAVAQQDGKYLVASDDGVRRYDANGKLDAKYGNKGFSALPFITKTAALQGDGKLIVAGVQLDATTGATPHHLTVMRLTATGAVDTTFATNGAFVMADGSGSEARAIALRAGKIVIGGRTSGFTNGILVRLDLNGLPDTTFAKTGTLLVKKHGGITDVSIAKNGEITTLVSPYHLEPSVAVLRVASNGKAATTFSQDGITDPQPMIGDGMFVTGDGGVQVIGHTPLGTRPLIATYTPQGGLISLKPIGGKGVLRVSPVQSADGNRYLFGTTATNLITDTRHIVVVRLTGDNRIDPAFGTKGLMVFSTTRQDLSFAATITLGNSLAIAGGAFSKTDYGGLSTEIVNVAL